MRSVRNFFFLFIPISVLLTVCKNVDNVSPTARNTFIKIYEKGNNYETQAVEPLPDGSGYIIASNLSFALGGDAFVSKTDNFGNILGTELILPGSTIISITVLKDGGYLVYGDGIKTNSREANLGDRTVTRAKIWKLTADLDQSKIDSVSFYKPSFGDTSGTTDFHGTGFTIDNNGNYVISGTKKANNEYFKAFVAVYNPTTLDTLWTRFYDLVDQDFVNAKNVFTNTSGQILWSNSVQKASGATTLSYITIPSVEQASVYSSYSFLGQNNTSSNNLQVQEMQMGLFGYGIVGTISDQQGNNGNLFFVRAGFDGEFQDNTITVLDGIQGTVGTGLSAISASPSSSLLSKDAGLVICPTSDGGFIIGGTMTSTIHRGNGLLDIWLIKLDASNAVTWNMVYGGTGDDIVNSIRPLSDGSFIVAGGSVSGTSIINGGLISAFLMRIDANGLLQK